jgi:phosphate transport system substrate-binding protein
VASLPLRPSLRALCLRALRLPALTAAALIAATAGCSSATSPVLAQSPASAAAHLPAAPAASTISLPETGSTLLFPLLRSWASAYHQMFPQVTISTAGTGSGAGITAASDGTATIGASDAYLSSGNLVSDPRLLNVPLAISAQQVNYYLPGLAPGVHLRLTGSVLAGMYSGSITSWDDPAIAQLNPGVRLPATTVVPLHRVESSGDTFLFSSYLATSDPAWNSAIGYGTTVAWPYVRGALAEHGNSGMVTGCRATPGCVAYIGISYLTKALAAGLGEAQLANASGNFELPTASSISAAASSFVSLLPPNETISMINGPAASGYPIVNYEYAIVSSVQPSATRARDLQAFLHWAITSGNSAGFLDQVRFEPLPADVVTLADAQIASIR